MIALIKIRNKSCKSHSSKSTDKNRLSCEMLILLRIKKTKKPYNGQDL